MQRNYRWLVWSVKVVDFPNKGTESPGERGMAEQALKRHWRKNVMFNGSLGRKIQQSDSFPATQVKFPSRQLRTGEPVCRAHRRHLCEDSDDGRQWTVTMNACRDTDSATSMPTVNGLVGKRNVVLYETPVVPLSSEEIWCQTKLSQGQRRPAS